MKASKKYQETRSIPSEARKGMKHTEEQRVNISEGRQKAKSEGRGVGWKHTPEMIEHMKAKRAEMWAEGRYKDMKPASRRRVSKTERALVPFLEALGYEHVDEDNHFYIHTPGKGMVPDFVDRKNKRVFEYFGNFWHHPDDEAFWIEQYRLAGWACTVLWESDLTQYVEDHRNLVTEEEAEAVLVFARMDGILSTRGNPKLPGPEELSARSFV